jgi:hypothetical protein
VVAYEKTGKDGKRFVMMDLGNVLLLDEAEFAKIQP